MKKKKVRVALRKNRQNRTRANDLTRRFRDDELTGIVPASVDRVRPKGELSRHRTIVEDSSALEEQGGSEDESAQPRDGLSISRVSEDASSGCTAS